MSTAPSPPPATQAAHVDVQPVARPFRRTVFVPGSKSITNRALPMAALANGESTLSGVLFADDTRAMLAALAALGYDLKVDEAARTVGIHGRGPNFPSRTASLFCGNSGTTIRFLAAMLTTGEGSFVLDGVARMRQRPIDQLVDQLRRLGATIDYPGNAGYPPVRVTAAGLGGGACEFKDAKSSQYISAVLMAAPYARKPVEVRLTGPVTSEPYVKMTLRMMRQWGIELPADPDRATPAVPLPLPPGQAAAQQVRLIRVPAGAYRPRAYAIEPDASNASYFLAAAALFKDAQVRVPGLSRDSLQGDAMFADVLRQMGAQVMFHPDAIEVTGTGRLFGLDVDMNAIPDMVQTLAVVALFATGPTTIRNVWNLRVKETDRLAALEAELRKLGATVATGPDWIRVEPPTAVTPASIATYDDHRMAMAFAIAGLKVRGVRILDPGCTAKTYPEYFNDLTKTVG